MKTRLAPWSIPVLSLILVLGCASQQNDPVAAPPPPDNEANALGIEGETALMSKPFSDEVYVVVSTVGKTFSASPAHVVIHNPGQKVIWIAEDPDVAIEITFRPDKEKDTPGAKPPDPPCLTPARKCGGRPIGGDVGLFQYMVSGTKGGKPMDPLDPVLEILP